MPTQRLVDPLFLFWNLRGQYKILPVFIHFWSFISQAIDIVTLTNRFILNLMGMFQQSATSNDMKHTSMVILHIHSGIWNFIVFKLIFTCIWAPRNYLVKKYTGIAIYAKEVQILRLSFGVVSGVFVSLSESFLLRLVV